MLRIAKFLFRLRGSLFATRTSVVITVTQYSQNPQTQELSTCQGEDLQADWFRGLPYMYPLLLLLYLHKVVRENRRQRSLPFLHDGQKESGFHWSDE